MPAAGEDTDELLEQMEQEAAAMKIQSVHRGNAARSKLQDRLARKETGLAPPPSGVDVQALKKLKKPELRQRAAEVGASAEEIEAARDEDDEKAAMIALIVARVESTSSGRAAAPPDDRYEDIREIQGSVRLVRHLESKTERVSKSFRDALQYAREKENLLLCKDPMGEVRTLTCLLCALLLLLRLRLVFSFSCSCSWSWSCSLISFFCSSCLCSLCLHVFSSFSSFCSITFTSRCVCRQQRIIQFQGEYEPALILYLEHAPGGSLKDLLRSSPQGLRCASCLRSSRWLSS